MARVPSATWSMLSSRTGAADLPRGLDAAWAAVGGMLSRCVRRRQRFMAQADAVLAMEKDFGDLSDARLREQANELRELLRRSRETPAQLLRAFAIIREIAWRQRGERPYAVQVAGALALEAGCITEMATGEGKTLTATMPATIGGWRGRGCHVITVNDYLARRDAELMTDIYRFCGLTTAWIDQEMAPADRRNAYLADITYCTNKEVTADYLRDRLALGRLKNLPSALLARIVDGRSSGTDRLLQRGLHQAIVDEADSVLIDEAVTPLIISGQAPNAEQVEAFKQAVELASQLEEGVDYRLNHRYREVDLTARGKERLAATAAPLGGIWAGRRRCEELVNQALVAGHYYQRDRQYVVDEDKIVIVDEFTGRLMPDRTWREGLHQAVEAKELVTVNPPKDTCARISFQRFFRMYRKLSGMTGTAAEAWPEFWQIYGRPVVLIPTNRPCIRALHRDRVFRTQQEKWQAVVEEIKNVHRLGRPILVGTRSVKASEHLSLLLTQNNLPHEILNAVRHAEEAQIVAGAGQPGRITVATNMAGRGTDIKLGRGMAELGGLHVIATERHESGRIDRQLFGRAARQGDPGSARAFVSMDDELIVRYAPLLGRMAWPGRPKPAASESPTPAAPDAPASAGPESAEPASAAQGESSSAIVRRLFNMAQKRAERLALRQRKGVLQTDNWLEESLGFAGREL